MPEATMASRPASRTPTHKKLVTYGKFSRRMQSNNSSQSAGTHSAPSKTPEPLIDPLTSTNAFPGRPSSTSSSPARSRLLASPKSQDGQDRARKRGHSLAFARESTTDELSEPSEKSRISQPTRTTPPTNTTNVVRHERTPQQKARMTTVEKRRPLETLQKSPSKLEALIGPQLFGDQPETERQSSAPKNRRPRLIDALAIQRDRSPSPEEGEEEEQSGITRRHARVHASELSDPSGSQLSVANLDRGDNPRRTGRQADNPRGKKIKITYSHSRSILSEPPKSDFDGSLGDDMAIPSPPEFPKPSAFDFDDDLEDEDDQRSNIKSIHELRRAGANNRFNDEMEDLLSRVGRPSRTPSSMRRNALLDLAHKLQRSDFIAQFRDHAARDKVAVGIASEADVVSGFALAAALVIFLSARPAPNLLRQLAEERVGRFLSYLLSVTDDIDEIASRRTTNLSRSSKASLGEIKKALFKLSIWHGYSFTELTPRTLALQLLDILYRSCEAHSLEEIGKDVWDVFSEVMESQLEEGSEHEVDFALVAFVLETQFNGASLSNQEKAWLSQEASRIAYFLDKALLTWPGDRKELETSIFKVAINTTNTVKGASAFANADLMRHLSSCICKGVRIAQDAVDQGKQQDSEVYEGLLLILGVMINALEHSQSARSSVDHASLESLLAVYLDNRLSMSEADSVEKSELSVAYGYLAVLLGYLSLEAPVRRKINERSADGEGMRGLLDSIRQFIDVYKNVDSKVHDLEGLVSEIRKQGR